MPSEQRKNIRYQSLANARIEGVNCGKAVLKDISVLGCCLASALPGDVKSEGRYEVEIVPEGAAGIGKFTMTVGLKWVRTAEDATEFGFAILESPKGKQFQRYVDYLAWRSGAGIAGEEP